MTPRDNALQDASGRKGDSIYWRPLEAIHADLLNTRWDLDLPQVLTSPKCATSSVLQAAYLPCFLHIKILGNEHVMLCLRVFTPIYSYLASKWPAYIVPITYITNSYWNRNMLDQTEPCLGQKCCILDVLSCEIIRNHQLLPSSRFSWYFRALILCLAAFKHTYIVRLF